MTTLCRVLILSMMLAVALSWPYPADPAPETANQEGPAAAAPVEGGEESVDGRWGGHRHHHHHGGWGHGSYGGYNNHYGGHRHHHHHGGYLGWREGQKTGEESVAAPVDAVAPPAPAPVPADNIKFD